MANARAHSDNHSGFKGVRRFRQYEKWEARILHIHIGYYNTAEEAARAYDKAVKEHFGEFARLNFGS